MRMRTSKFKYVLTILVIAGMFSCKNKTDKKEAAKPIFKGLYTLSPEAKIFTDCATGKEYWVADSSAQLELKYWQEIPAEKPEPVYIEVEGNIVPSNENDNGGHEEGGYEKTLIVRKLITITKDIPQKGCKLQ